MIKYFDSIPATPKRQMILARLGHNSTQTVLEREQAEFLEKGIQRGLALCRLQGAYARFKIAARTEASVTLETGETFASASLAKLLANSGEVLLMACTAGKPPMEAIAAELENGNAALALILDATASQKADAGLDWLEEFMEKLLLREGRCLTRHRYSPGYGDLALSNQKIIYDALGLQKFGLELTERFLLIPEKSVLAIAGIENRTDVHHNAKQE
jgi:hypothetical protein